MQTIKYIKELEKKLLSLEKESRDNIINEIQSYIDESDSTYDLLCEKFGTPKNLAKSYLEDTPIQETTKSKILRYGSNILKILGIILLLIIIIVTSIVYFYAKDNFNYSAYNASSITTKIDRPWIEVSNIQNIKIEQSKVIFYWSDKNKLKYSCKGKISKHKNNSLFIKQSACYVLLPKKQINIDTYQTYIVAIEPKTDINFNLEQTRLKIEENEKNYKYDFDLKQSSVSNIESKQSNIKINVKAYQSKVSNYKF